MSTEYRGVGGVYFIEAPELGLIKIGVSEDVSRRFSQIQLHSPAKLRIMLVIVDEDTPYEIESYLHKILRHWRVRGEWFKSGEWFEPIVKILASEVEIVDERELLQKPRKTRKRKGTNYAPTRMYGRCEPLIFDA